jgi:hypothetical protein
MFTNGFTKNGIYKFFNYSLSLDVARREAAAGGRSQEQ